MLHHPAGVPASSREGRKGRRGGLKGARRREPAVPLAAEGGRVFSMWQGWGGSSSARMGRAT